jgi:hypothetical protein
VAKSGGHVNVWNVMFGLGVVVDTCGAGVVVLGRGTVRLLQASAENKTKLSCEFAFEVLSRSLSWCRVTSASSRPAISLHANLA